MPLDPPAGPLSLRAVELISGKTATVSVTTIAAAGPRGLLDVLSSHMRWDTGQALRVVGREHDGGAPIEQLFGPHLKDVAISPRGDLVVLNAMNWDENLYGVDLSSGTVRWRQRLGNHFTYAPQATAQGFAVEAFDRTTAEGYHLYLVGRDGKPERRFALYGLAEASDELGLRWAASCSIALVRLRQTSPDGDWVASAGDLGLVVSGRDGRRRWGLDWWRTARRHMILVALNRDTLVTLEGMTVTAYGAHSGQTQWSLHLGDGGALQGGIAGADGVTLVVRADINGGRVFVIRGGRLLNTVASAADDIALSRTTSLEVPGRHHR